jgi:hypothetical protein
MGEVLFVTTCVNAPAIDPIFLWRSPDEVDALVRACGLEIVEALRRGAADREPGLCAAQGVSGAGVGAFGR